MNDLKSDFEAIFFTVLIISVGFIFNHDSQPPSDTKLKDLESYKSVEDIINDLSVYEESIGKVTGGVFLGQLASEIEGKPYNISKTEHEYGTTEFWYYRYGYIKLIVIVNGRVDSIHKEY